MDGNAAERICTDGTVTSFFYHSTSLTNRTVRLKKKENDRPAKANYKQETNKDRIGMLWVIPFLFFSADILIVLCSFTIYFQYLSPRAKQKLPHFFNGNLNLNKFVSVIEAQAR